MLIDCDGCGIRGAGCADCLVTALLDDSPTTGLDAAERRAVEVFARAGFDVEVLGHEPGPPVRRRVPGRRRAA
ncbi:hypothetical protein [Micromonospora psammae]|uniref:hypothetical protein n=1 Tax=Micromonospora sp. CPCC 205556 TaxID=3122398 RepID=UPI002FF21718